MTALERDERGWWISSSANHAPEEREHFDHVLLATPVHVASKLLSPLDEEIAPLMPAEASSAVIACFGFDEAAQVPPCRRGLASLSRPAPMRTRC